MTVYVVAFQHRVPGEGVGGFDWFRTRIDAEHTETERICSDFYGSDYEHALFLMEVPDDLADAEITSMLDGDYIDALCAAVQS